MIGLPRSTEFNKYIPKQKFYENLTVSPALKRVFTDQVSAIYWRNKIASSTLNLASGKNVTEVEVFEVKLDQIPPDEDMLRQIDRALHYHILFLLEYEGKYQAWIAYKEASSGGMAFKVGTYYHTDWLPEEELPLRLDGLDMDAVYENFVRQIAGEALQAETAEESLADSVTRDERRKTLKKQIAQLEAKIHKEKQLNKQMEWKTKLKGLTKELEELENGKNAHGIRGRNAAEH